MASITMTLVVISGVMLLLTFVFPLILMIFVNKRIEKRYKCKLNIDVPSRMFMPFYAYYKYFNPGNSIAIAFILNSKKALERNKCLKEINYNIKKAPKIEIFICVFCYVTLFFAVLFSAIAFILMEIYDIK